MILLKENRIWFMILGEGERGMRKRILILSLSLLAICFVGCGREKGDGAVKYQSTFPQKRNKKMINTIKQKHNYKGKIKGENKK